MATTTTHNALQVKDNYSFALSAPNSVNAYVLTAGTPVDITVSALTDANNVVAKIIDFSADQNFYVLWNNTTAAVPTTNNTAGTAPELNPGTRNIGSMTTFSIVSAVSCVVTMKIYPY